MTEILFGAGGQLGTALQNIDSTIIPLRRDECNICNADQVLEKLSQNKCDLVINAAAWTSVDDAEEHIAATMAVNEEGSLNIAKACAELDIPLIYFSTDYVFDGQKTEPYTEEDEPHPLSIYGQSKLAGENTVRDTLEHHIIIRTSWVFSAYGQNFLKTMMRLTKEKEALTIIDDQIGSPTPADDLAHTVLAIAQHITKSDFNDWGTYHYAGTPETSWHGFASQIIDALKEHDHKTPDTLIPIPTAQYKQAAKRPPFSVLSCEKIRTVFGIEQPDWKAATETIINELVGKS